MLKMFYELCLVSNMLNIYTFSIHLFLGTFIMNMNRFNSDKNKNCILSVSWKFW